MQLRSWLPSSDPSTQDRLLPLPANSSSESNSRSNDHGRDELFSQNLKRSYEALLEQPPESLVLAAFLLGSVSTLAVTRVHKRYYRRFPNSDWITPDVFAKKRWIKGVVTSVGDADNFRLYHTPGLGWSLPLKLRFIPSKSKDLKDQTLHIRMAGIDAPEAAHFGKPAQPFAEEALAWLKGRVEGKTVYCQLISRDQYSRVVAVPMLPPRILPAFLTPRFGRCLSLEMLRDGWAVTYEQAGVVYGRWGKEHFVELETKAKAARRGQWASGAPSESPAAYKRRYASAQMAKSGSEPAANVLQDLEKAAGTQVSEKRGWLGWLRRK